MEGFNNVINGINVNVAHQSYTDGTSDATEINFGEEVTRDNIETVAGRISEFVLSHDYIAYGESSNSVFHLKVSSCKDASKEGHDTVDIARIRDDEGIYSVIMSFGKITLRVSVNHWIIITHDMIMVEKVRVTDSGANVFGRVGLVAWEPTPNNGTISMDETTEHGRTMPRE